MEERIALGIDAGGTYTDAVIYDVARNRVLSKNKAMTTRDDLARGIAEAIRGLDRSQFSSIAYAAISTTLATNAIVEGRGGVVGLLLFPAPGSADDGVEHQPRAVLRGRIGIQGEVLEEPDRDEIRTAVAALIEQAGAEALAVSGYASVRNPSHELLVKETVRQSCPLPVVCGHELASSLDYVRRANTAVLNARLLPLIRELVESLRRTLDAQGLPVPLMVVKGDGGVISEPLALERPIETILSGPAASILGAWKLTGAAESTIVDMGGTTTDVARIRGGRPAVSELGAAVGGWRTSVPAVEVITEALGGDSRVWLSPGLELHVGPERVVPLSFLGTERPEILRTLSAMRAAFERTREIVPVEFLLYVREQGTWLTAGERELLALVKRRTLTRHEAAAALGRAHWRLLDSERLERCGLIQAAAVTPTDALHVLGRLSLWSAEAAAAGIQVLALQKGRSPETFAEDVLASVRRKLALVILRRQLDESPEGPRFPGCPFCERLFANLFDSSDSSYRLSLSIRDPVVAIGAPVRAYFPELKSVLNTSIVMPEHAEVANAVGAGAAEVVVDVESLIHARGAHRFVVHTPRERREFESRDQALAFARRETVVIARERARAAGAGQTEPSLRVFDHAAPARDGNTVLLETRVIARIEALPIVPGEGTG